MKETWLDWVPASEPDTPVLTRGELLASLERLGPQVSERQLRFWEAEGVLPGPVRRRHNGATRALYPAWMPLLVCDLRICQLRGYSLCQLPSIMRARAQIFTDAELWI
jgi:DNA-binding transcriptional MerR regulator